MVAVRGVETEAALVCIFLSVGVCCPTLVNIYNDSK